MDVDIQCQPSYALAYCILDAGESVLVERGAMVAMSGNISASVGIGGNVAHAILRKAVAKESFFMGRYTAAASQAWVACAPSVPGDIEHIRLNGNDSPILVEAGSLLVAGQGIDIEVRYAGLRNVILREGAVFVKLSGKGDALISAFGGIQRYDLKEGDTIIIDTGHVVAFQESVGVRVGPLSSIAVASFTGEGIVGEFTGPGSVWAQSRAEGAFRSWLFPDDRHARQ